MKKLHTEHVLTIHFSLLKSYIHISIIYGVYITYKVIGNATNVRGDLHLYALSYMSWSLKKSKIWDFKDTVISILHDLYALPCLCRNIERERELIFFILQPQEGMERTASIPIMPKTISPFRKIETKSCLLSPLAS